VTTRARGPIHRVRVLQNSREFGKRPGPTARFLPPEFGNECDYNLVRHSYERGSVLLTSNLPFSQWTQIFKDPMTTTAAIDRLVHHSVILELNVPSYRLETAQTAKKSVPPASRVEE